MLTKMDFEQERYIKKRLYGKEFENMDCPDLVKNYLHGVTSLHTFNNDFMFVVFNSTCIPCSWMHSEKRCSLNKVVSLCEMAKMCLVMMSFVHNQIEHISLILHETYDHWSVAVFTVTVHSSFFPHF